jgi:hypothetical protein
LQAKQQRTVECTWVGQIRPFPTGILCLWAWLLAGTSQAQLAITEVMSQASTNYGAQLVIPKSDFWELTNFGTNTISLDNYTFSDRDSDPGSRVGDPFRKCVIAPGESIIILRTDAITNRQDFLNWWGVTNVPAGLQVRTAPKKPGFDAAVDAVQLFDPSGALVDRVDFGRALRGKTFVYDSESGEFGKFSTAGAHGAVMAVQADDVGSPGLTTGPVPLSILEQPANVIQDAGLDAEFSIRAAGLPRPTFQWFFNGQAISGAKSSSLTISNIQPWHAGNYTVRIGNGIVSMFSQPATLLVNTNPTPAMILVPPMDATIFEGQSTTFSVKARGYPSPTFQWQLNGANIPNATNRTLTVSGATLAMSGRLYTVRVQNPYATVNASARLIVTPPPYLVITEVMASVAGGTASGHAEWFELTNMDTNAVDLCGYRFSDRYSFELSYRITNSLVIQPGESVIFVERLRPEEFIAWWGKDRLQPNVKITTYYGLGLSSEGDVINFWNSAETDPYLPVTAAGFARSLPGVSLRFVAPDYFFAEDSIAGKDGAFNSENNGDIASPGLTANPPPRFISISMTPYDAQIRCRVTQGKSYSLESKLQIDDPTWYTVGSYTATDCTMTISQPVSGMGRYFLLKELP